MYISDYFQNFSPTYTTGHLDMWQSVFFTHTDWFYAVNPFCSSLNCCLSLANHCSQACSAFDHILAKKMCQKFKCQKNAVRSYLFCVSIKLQFHNTWITLTSNSKMLQIIFYWAWNAIYNFTKHANLIYAYGLMYTFTNLTLHMLIFIA